MAMKFIFVTGGVISGLGKGITASSIGFLLKYVCGFRVTAIKIDPYLNLDAGTMSPFEHGEAYVLSDGGETDLDLGNYERFLDINLTRDHNITTGKVYSKILEKERRGDYLGKTVQMVPHLTNLVQKWIREVAEVKVCDKKADVCIVELGGTVGDLESAIFLESISQLVNELNDEDSCTIHVSLLPKIWSGEQKTKPTQQTIKMLRQSGISPDFLCLRSEEVCEESTLEKVAKLCIMKRAQIFTNTNVPNIYYVPQLFFEQNLHLQILKKLEMSFANVRPQFPTFYNKILIHYKSQLPKIIVGIVGKYTGLSDSYLSLIRALEHASFFVGKKLQLIWFNSEDFTLKPNRLNELKQCNALVIPGGFGIRGIEGKIAAANFARLNHIPTLGICLGMQVMCIEFCRNQLGLGNANSQEFDDESENQIVHILPENLDQENLGGTMRLGSKITKIVGSSQISELYKTIWDCDGESHCDDGEIDKCYMERYRHRFEINKKYIDKFHNAGFMFTGYDKSGQRLEICELSNSSFYIGCQFHPEYQSRFHRPHPLFVGLMKNSKKLIVEI
jgi:CTP synthase